MNRFLSIRRLQILFILSMALITKQNKPISSKLKTSILIMALGTIVMNLNQFREMKMGIIYGFINNLLTAIYLELSAFISKKTKIEPLCIPIFLLFYLNKKKNPI